jgi:hypothetical protein
MNSINKTCILGFITLLVLAGCGKKKIDEPIPDTWAMPKQECPNGTDKSVLAGRWRYLEQGSSYLLSLDEQGNGSYAWKDGRFVSVCLDRQTWRGHWLQSENDREGGFEVQLNRQLTAGEGRWWYSRIGEQSKPNQTAGNFRIERMANDGRAGLPQQDAEGGLPEDTTVTR